MADDFTSRRLTRSTSPYQHSIDDHPSFDLSIFTQEQHDYAGAFAAIEAERRSKFRNDSIRMHSFIEEQTRLNKGKTVVEDSCLMFSNISPTTNEMEVYQLSDPVVGGVEVHALTDQDDFDDFSSTPPVLGNKRSNPDIGPSTAKHSKRSKLRL
ncbi:hypothetical protein HAX54_017519 [Datura stramonium]|uniref:Uncharacterized protein n=1 Tax=Datura stramonium TaxID=4076 RepID=A0ABS8UN45_DATST|nr:hypothetical protein [Datura stramonium]